MQESRQLLQNNCGLTKPCGLKVILICQRFGIDYNLAVWRFFACSSNLNNVDIVLELLICIAAMAFCQIKVTPITITNQFTKYLTRQ